MTDDFHATVVIPCLNAEATLGTQLQALLDQQGARRFEVIVADNGSTDGSRHIAKDFANRGLDLQIIEASDRAGAAHARNCGARSARSEHLLFCDADDEVDGQWVSAMTEALRDHDLVASRFDTVRLNSAAVQRLHGTHPQSIGLNPYTYPDYLPHAGGGGLGVKRAVHENLQGFDESLLTLEDTDYCWRAQLAGFDFFFAANAVVSIRYPTDLDGAFHQGANYGFHNVAIYARYRDRGMPHLGPTRGLIKALALILRSPGLLLKDRRPAWFWQAGWRYGRLRGCLRYHVGAL